MRPSFFRIPLCFSALVLGCSASCSQNGASLITGFDRPYLFAYGAWDKVAKIENGRLALTIPNGQGGLGDNFAAPLDLKASADSVPTLHLRIGPNNREKTLCLMLLDTKGGSGTWNFSLENQKSEQEIVLSPLEGASLSTPNTLGDKGAPDLSQILQWQVQGDWGGEAVDVSLDSVEIMVPDAAILASRAAAQKQSRDEAEALRLDRAAQKARSPRGPKSPLVSRIAPVSPDVLALEIAAGHITPGKIELYIAIFGDSMVDKKNEQGVITERKLVRGGQEIGFLIGPKRNWLALNEGLEGDPLLEFEADNLENFAVSSPDDAFYAAPQKPVALGRITTPTKWTLGTSNFEMRHTLFLRLPRPLENGKRYSISLGGLNTRQLSVNFVNDAAKTRSDAVHVNQIGYRSDDPLKRAFVSCWMGTGGALKLPDSLKFSLVEDKSGKTVFSGRSSDIWRADKPEKMAREANFNATDVARLDFSSFGTPGRYRVVVEGVGCSYPFEIGPDVWTCAFLTQMKGLYNQRSGVELGPPYTPFRKPRDMKPGDAGVRITQSTYRAVEKGGEAFAELAAGNTGVEVKGAWGGYHDAGDWNPRRVTHMKVTMAQLELLDLFPQKYAVFSLNIPPVKGVPDILTEAQFEFDCFRRLQKPDGGVPFGIESPGDPYEGEVSWLQSMPLYVFAPDYHASWFYAGVGARLSYLLQKYDAKTAALYKQSAIRAFEWAERDFEKDNAAGLIEKRGTTWEALDARNLAALELYRLTRDKKWHEIFLQNTLLSEKTPDLFQWGKGVQRDAAFLYARLPAGLGDPKLRAKAVAALESMANRALSYADDNAFNLTTPDRGKPQFIGFYTAPDATDLTRAHFLTGKAKYLAGAVQATQFGAGNNPNNLVYTTGLGANPVTGAFKLDSRRTGQTVPVGLTPYGNVDLGKWGDQNFVNWPITYFLSKNTTPNPYSWPTTQAYWDLGAWPALNEFTVDAWAPNVAVWGYLAARK